MDKDNQITDPYRAENMTVEGKTINYHVFGISIVFCPEKNGLDRVHNNNCAACGMKRD